MAFIINRRHWSILIFFFINAASATDFYSPGDLAGKINPKIKLWRADMVSRGSFCSNHLSTNIGIQTRVIRFDKPSNARLYILTDPLIQISEVYVNNEPWKNLLESSPQLLAVVRQDKKQILIFPPNRPSITIDADKPEIGEPFMLINQSPRYVLSLKKSDSDAITLDVLSGELIK